jgi:hypothetical protein
MTKEKVAEMRKQLRKEFPNLKISVVYRDGRSIDVSIMEGDINFSNNEGNSFVNHYYIDRDYSKNEPALKILKRMKEIVSRGNYIVSEDGDYGSIPNFYYHINIGKWDIPYKLRTNELNNNPINKIDHDYVPMTEHPYEIEKV